MASIHETKAGYEIRWRYAGRQFNQTAGTASRPKAEDLASRINETIQAIKQGWIKLPDGSDYETTKRFILTRGEVTSPDRIEAPRVVLTLAGLFALYRDSLPSNEASTLYTEGIHEKHLTSLLGKDKAVESICSADMQSYADARKRGYRAGSKNFKPVGPSTINKELKTFGKVWNWGVNRGHVSGLKPWQPKNLDMV
jgi:hypothetical protein